MYLVSPASPSPAASGVASTGSAARSSYHHGDLRRALIEATAALIEEDGPGGFSLRKVARRAGVSPAAPSHHFGDSRGLLTAVAVEGFERMMESWEAIDADLDPYQRLIAHARCYVDFAIRCPGHMAIMFRRDLVDGADEAYGATAPQAYQRISTAVQEAIGDVSGVDLDGATKTIWATCHGLADLYAGKGESLKDDAVLDHLVDHATSIVYHGVRAV